MLVALDSYDDSLGREARSWMGVRSYLAFFSHPPHNPAKEGPNFPDEETAAQRGKFSHPRPQSSGHDCDRWLQLSLVARDLTKCRSVG